LSTETDGQASKELPVEDLRKRIVQFLESTNMCVLATCGSNIPRATPIEYHSDGLSIYFVGEPGIKLKNIADNPNVSVGVFLPYTGWDSAKGAQITGVAKIISRDNRVEFEQGLEVCRWEKISRELGIVEFPKTVELVKVEARKIEFVDMSLKKLGFRARHTFEC
jgi:uncharacterized protein (UPF0276 family)